jgi:hypothetical protein
MNDGGTLWGAIKVIGVAVEVVALVLIFIFDYREYGSAWATSAVPEFSLAGICSEN